MNIIVGTTEIPVIRTNPHRVIVEGLIQDYIEVVADRMFTQAEIDAMSSHESWSVYENPRNIKKVEYFNIPVEYSVYFKKKEITPEVVAEKNAKITELNQEKTLFVDSLPLLLADKTPDIVLKFWQYFPEWVEGAWEIGDNVRHNNYPYNVVQAHDSTGNPTWTPDVTPSLFSPWHGVSYDTALPWLEPTGAQDMYKVNEYMIFTDTFTYKCLSDTNYSPSEYAEAWQKIS